MCRLVACINAAPHPHPLTCRNAGQPATVILHPTVFKHVKENITREKTKNEKPMKSV
jgi:hypothetical protein